MPNIIVMAFSPRNIVGCLLKKGLQRGWSRAPQDPPLATAPLEGPIHLDHKNCLNKTYAVKVLLIIF